MNKLMIAVMAVAGLNAGAMKAARLEKMVDARVEVFLDDADARPDQREKAKELEAQVKSDLQPLAKQTLANRVELQRQWSQPVVDRLAVHAAVDRELDGAKVFMHQVADAMIALHDLLTPEQRAKAAERRE